MGYIGRYTAPSIVDLESPVSVDGTTIIENGVLKNVGIDGIKLKSSGDSITKSDGTTAVLSESAGVVTLTADVANVGSATISGGSITGTEIDLKSSGTTIFASNGTTAVLSESGGVVTVDADNFIIDNAGKISSLGQIELQIDTDNNQSGTYIGFSRNNTTSERLALFHENGDVSFYEDTGTTAKLYWDASEQYIIITKDLAISTTSSGGSILLSSASNSTNSTGQLLNGISFSGQGTGRRRALIANLQSGGTTTGGDLAFYTSSSAAGNDTVVQRMLIDAYGSVTINNLGTGDVLASSGTLYIGSDIRLKNDLGAIDESGIEIIKQLTPRYYSWKEDENNRKQLGFFAQEVFPILPEAVPRDLKYEQNGVDENGEPILEQVLDENGEPDYQWGFATQPIVAMLVKAIQEQQTLIESQQSQIDALTSKNQEQDFIIASLISRIEALETQP